MRRHVESDCRCPTGRKQQNALTALAIFQYYRERIQVRNKGQGVGISETLGNVFANRDSPHFAFLVQGVTRNLQQGLFRNNSSSSDEEQSQKVDF